MRALIFLDLKKGAQMAEHKSPLDWLVKPSTRKFRAEGKRTDSYSFFDWLHGYVYGRWPYLYIAIGVGEHPLAKLFARLYSFYRKLRPPSSDPGPKRRPPYQLDPAVPTQTTADGYHGKVVTLEAATQLVTINEPIRLPNLEQVIPYVRARDIVLQNPDHIIALECPCRSARQNPCLPLDVCLVVGEPFASFVAEHHPEKIRWISSAEAVDILKAEEERGHVHHAFFKDAMLGRFYAICNCCSCCCGAMHAHQTGTPMLASSGYVSQVDESLCIGCETCASVCQFGAIRVVDYISQVDEQLCMGCGACVSHCEQGALSLRRAPEKGEPLEIFRLLDQAAQ